MHLFVLSSFFFFSLVGFYATCCWSSWTVNRPSMFVYVFTFRLKTTFRLVCFRVYFMFVLFPPSFLTPKTLITAASCHRSSRHYPHHS